MPKIERIALTVKEIAETIGVSAGHIRNKIRAGDLKAIKIGRRVLVTMEALNKWLETCGDKSA